MYHRITAEKPSCRSHRVPNIVSQKAPIVLINIALPLGVLGPGLAVDAMLGGCRFGCYIH